jgi:hypothetical protein
MHHESKTAPSSPIRVKSLSSIQNATNEPSAPQPYQSSSQPPPSTSSMMSPSRSPTKVGTPIWIPKSRTPISRSESYRTRAVPTPIRPAPYASSFAIAKPVAPVSFPSSAAVAHYNDDDVDDDDVDDVVHKPGDFDSGGESVEYATPEPSAVKPPRYPVVVISSQQDEIEDQADAPVEPAVAVSVKSSSPSSEHDRDEFTLDQPRSMVTAEGNPTRKRGRPRKTSSGPKNPTGRGRGRPKKRQVIDLVNEFDLVSSVEPTAATSSSAAAQTNVDTSEPRVRRARGRPRKPHLNEVQRLFENIGMLEGSATETHSRPVAPRWNAAKRAQLEASIDPSWYDLVDKVGADKSFEMFKKAFHEAQALRPGAWRQLRTRRSALPGNRGAENPLHFARKPPAPLKGKSAPRPAKKSAAPPRTGRPPPIAAVKSSIRPTVNLTNKTIDLSEESLRGGSPADHVDGKYDDAPPTPPYESAAPLAAILAKEPRLSMEIDHEVQLSQHPDDVESASESSSSDFFEASQQDEGDASRDASDHMHDHTDNGGDDMDVDARLHVSAEPEKEEQSVSSVRYHDISSEDETPTAAGVPTAVEASQKLRSVGPLLSYSILAQRLGSQLSMLGSTSTASDATSSPKQPKYPLTSSTNPMIPAPKHDTAPAAAPTSSPKPPKYPQTSGLAVSRNLAPPKLFSSKPKIAAPVYSSAPATPSTSTSHQSSPGSAKVLAPNSRTPILLARDISQTPVLANNTARPAKKPSPEPSSPSPALPANHVRALHPESTPTRSLAPSRHRPPVQATRVGPPNPGPSVRPSTIVQTKKSPPSPTGIVRTGIALHQPTPNSQAVPSRPQPISPLPRAQPIAIVPDRPMQPNPAVGGQRPLSLFRRPSFPAIPREGPKPP